MAKRAISSRISEDFFSLEAKVRRYEEEKALSEKRRDEARPQRDADHERVQALRLNYKPETPLTSYAKLEDGYTERHGGPLREDEEPWLDEMGEARNVRELCFE